LCPPARHRRRQAARARPARARRCRAVDLRRAGRRAPRRGALCRRAQKLARKMTGNEFEQHLTRFRKMPVWLRVVYSRPRAVIAIGVGIAVYIALAALTMRPVTRMLIGWDA